MKIRPLFLIALITLLSASSLQAQTWYWGNCAGSNGYDIAKSVAVDAAGNSFITGHYAGDSATFGTTTFHSPSPGTARKEYFLAKYSPSGATMWSRTSTAGLYDESGEAVATDAAGNVYVAGSYSSDSVTLGTTVLHRVIPGWRVLLDQDIFIAKYDNAGTLLWVRTAGTRYDDVPTGITVDPSGDVYVTGIFADDSIRFGSSLLLNASAGYSTDMFLAKYSPAGVPLWARREGGYGLDAASSVKTDRSGNVFIAGKFQSDTIFMGTTMLINDSAGTDDVFLAAYTSAGSLLWARSAGGVRDDNAVSLTTDTSGNVYLAGNFTSSSIQFGTYTLVKAAAVSTFSDVFLVKYSAGGSVLWAKRAGSFYNDWLWSVAIDTSSYVYIAGEFYLIGGSSLYFDAIELYPYPAGGTGFLAKYDPATGAALSAHRMEIDNASMAIDASNNMFIAGCLYGPATFGSSTPPFVAATDIVLAKTSDTCTPPLLPPIAGLSAVCTGDSISLTNGVAAGAWSTSSSFYATVSGTGWVTGHVPGSVIISYLMTRDCGSSYAVTHAVTINVSPAAGAITGSSTVCVGETITLAPSVAGGTWSTPGLNATVSATGDVTGVTAGLALISYTVSNSCGDAAAIKLITVVPTSDCPTGLPAVAKAEGINIYPSPAYDELTIMATEKIKRIAIINAVGQTLIEKTYPNVEKVVTNIGHLPPGMYLIRVNDTWVRKMVKE